MPPLSATIPYPPTLPPNTVVGRIGAGQSGPAEAIPIQTLFSIAMVSNQPAINSFMHAAFGGL